MCVKQFVKKFYAIVLITPQESKSIKVFNCIKQAQASLKNYEKSHRIEVVQIDIPIDIWR